MSILLTEQEVDACFEASDGTRVSAARAIQLALIEKMRKEPVVWMQSDHLSKFEKMACGSSMMLARCSFKQAQDDFKPLYRLPTPQELGES